jgi:tetratricopeptide (TPR) repeat protein
MLQRDWLMRQIEQAGRMLGAIIAKLRSGQTADVLGLFDQAYRPLLGVGAAALPYLSDEQLLDMLRPGGSADDRRWPVLARLLAVEADLYERQGARAEALARLRRAMLLLNELGGWPQREPELAAEVAGKLRAYRLRPETRLDVVSLYEASGRYADAEDAVFEGLDDPDPERPAADPDGEQLLVDEAIALYRRLLALPDAELDGGGLPRAEVLAGLSELLARPVPAGAGHAILAGAAGQEPDGREPRADAPPP